MGTCDVADTCSGLSAACPLDVVTTAGVTCRAAANQCDEAEVCTGTSGSCPTDVFKPVGATCADDGNGCTSDTCDVVTAPGLSATYFSNVDLTGTTVTRVDANVDFNWGGTSPDALIPTSNYSARWTGQVLAPNAGSYTFEVEADDGVRFYFDNLLVVDKWIDQGATKYSYTVTLAAGTKHDVKMEYYQKGGGAVARLRWTGPSISYAIIPSTNLFPSAAGASVAICNHTTIAACSRGLTVTYYDNANFTGPSVARVDPTIDFEWGNGSPDPAIGTDTYSARWTGQIQPAGSGSYTFETETDDGVRLWINNVLVVDKFIDQGPTKYTASVVLVAGVKYDIKMDYYENGGGATAHLRLTGPGTSYGPIPNNWLYPTGDSGIAGLSPTAGGNNGTGDPYVVWQLSNTPGTAPVNVTSTSANNWGLGDTVMMVPAFSPDGSKLVFIDGDSGGGAGWRKGLSIFDFDQAAKKFSNRKLVRNTWPFGDVMKWPAFESDSRSVVFQTSTPTELCTTCDGKTGARYGNMAPTNYYGTPGTLWSIDAGTNGSSAVQLAQLNTGERAADANKSYQPTVLPVSAGGYRWAVFTSTRPYGNTLNPPGMNTSCLASQLWVAAIDDTTSGNVDRSHPAFWLPNQNLGAISSSNYINERAYWVLDPCKAAGTGAASVCQVNEDCCGATAVPPTAACRIDQPATVPPTRHCVGLVGNACSADGGTCGSDKDCCGYPSSHCIAGLCKPPAPVSVFENATFSRDYEGACAKGSTPVWRFFDWKAITPSDTTIVFSAQTSDSVVGLDTAPSVVVGKAQGVTPPGWVGNDVGAALPQQASKHYLRITMTFNPSSDKLSSPSLSDWRQSFSCRPSE
ncbi:MAG TPA: PA14 domain-containing protein [Polyangiaceae bacterium]|nr:PA14 domain-containing protein [Polyangiaceae bacterium]